MGLFSRNNQATSVNDPFFEYIRGYSDTTGDNLPLADGFHNSAIYSAVRLISGDLASNRIISDSDYFAKLINDKPNSDGTGYDLKRSIANNLLLYGNAYTYTKRSKANNSVQELRFIPYVNMRLDVDTDAQTIKYTWLTDTGQRQLKNDEVLHFRLSPDDGLTGVSPLRALLDQRRNMADINQSIHEYYGKPLIQYLLKLNAGAVDPEGKKHMANEFTNAVARGGGASSGVMVTDQTADVQQFPHSEDQNIIKLFDSITTASKKDIASVYGIPVDWLGVESEHNNNDQSKQFYIEHGLVNYMDAITYELAFKLGTGFKYDLSRLLNTDITTQSQMAIDQLNAGIITKDEARKMLNLPALDNDTEQE